MAAEPFTTKLYDNVWANVIASLLFVAGSRIMGEVLGYEFQLWQAILVFVVSSIILLIWRHHRINHARQQAYREEVKRVAAQMKSRRDAPKESRAEKQLDGVDFRSVAPNVSADLRQQHIIKRLEGFLEQSTEWGRWQPIERYSDPESQPYAQAQRFVRDHFGAKKLEQFEKKPSIVLEELLNQCFDRIPEKPQTIQPTIEPNIEYIAWGTTSVEEDELEIFREVRDAPFGVWLEFSNFPRKNLAVSVDQVRTQILFVDPDEPIVKYRVYEGIWLGHKGSIITFPAIETEKILLGYTYIAKDPTQWAFVIKDNRIDSVTANRRGMMMGRGGDWVVYVEFFDVANAKLIVTHKFRFKVITNCSVDLEYLGKKPAPQKLRGL